MDNISEHVKALIPEPIELILRRMRRYSHSFQEQRFKPYIIKKNVEGVVFDYWIGDITGRQWYEINDPDWIEMKLEMRFIRDHLIQPGDVILECGAHHGRSTIVLSNWVGSEGKVVAFEPHPKNAENLQKNIDLNNLRNIILEQKAVGQRNGRIQITGESNSLVITKGTGVEVEMTSLDEYFDLNPTFLRIDVEGFEVEVLKGAKNILATRPKLAIEIHTRTLKHFDSSVDDLFNLIDVEQYDLWI
ncbi:MAG: FkbM family methyltransferase, partial [Anaerolineales bacterium]|nr:FkbM family methyltransferase [Anaerolineales bacterium]